MACSFALDFRIRDWYIDGGRGIYGGGEFEVGLRMRGIRLGMNRKFFSGYLFLTSFSIEYFLDVRMLG